MRARADLITRTDAALRATVSPMPEQGERTIEVDAYVRRLHELIDRALSLSSGLSQELRAIVAGIDDPLRLVYLLSSLLDMKADEKQRILENDTLDGKLEAISGALNREIALLETQRQDRVGRAAGDDRRAAAVLPAPTDESDSGRARRRRTAGGAGFAQARRRRQTAGGRCSPSPHARSVGSNGCRQRRPSTK